MGSQADVAISVLREMRNMFCSLATTFARGSEREELDASRCSGTLSSTRFSVNSSNHSGRSRNESPVLLRCHFYVSSVSTGPRDGSSRSLSLILSVLVDTGCCEGITASCGKDVGDVGEAELEKPVDGQGQRSYVVRRVAFYSSSIFDELWFLTTGPMVGIHVIFAEFTE